MNTEMKILANSGYFCGGGGGGGKGGGGAGGGAGGGGGAAAAIKSAENKFALSSASKDYVRSVLGGSAYNAGGAGGKTPKLAGIGGRTQDQTRNNISGKFQTKETLKKLDTKARKNIADKLPGLIASSKTAGGFMSKLRNLVNQNMGATENRRRSPIG